MFFSVFYQCLFSSHGFSAHVLQCFYLFDVVRPPTYLGSKKRIFSKFRWFVFKRLSWTFAISTFCLKMVLLNHILSTLTHICLPKRKVKKYTTCPFLLNSTPAVSNGPSRRGSFQTSKVEETYGTMIVIIHILSTIFILRKWYEQVGHIWQRFN